MNSQHCPSNDILRLYSTGELPEAEAESVILHLESCSSCLGRLNELAGQPDSLLAALRQPHESDSGNFITTPLMKQLKGNQEVAAGAVLNGYRLVEELGRGGMGRVYRAVHPRLDHEVAIKVLRPGLLPAPLLARFEAERQMLTLMDHPNIARIIDGGMTEEGQSFLAMELVRGTAITQYCDEHCLDLSQRLVLFMQVCQAVQHAHQKGIIHRDLKPSNVLVTEYDGKPVPKIIDFGVAKVIDERAAMAETKMGMVVGTPEYMSPEQASLAPHTVDTRSDVYALGVLLYELLTGVTPFGQKARQSIPMLEFFRVIREEEALAPSSRLTAVDTIVDVAAHRATEPGRLLRHVRGELDWIVLKCLEKEPARRYETAIALADDLKRFLNDDPVLAGPPSSSYRFKKFVRRNRIAIGALAAFMALLITATIVAAGLAWWANSERVRAEKAENHAIILADQEGKARLTAEKRLDQINKAVAILGGVFEKLDPRAEELGEKSLRSQLGEQLDRAASQIGSDEIADPKTIASLLNTLGNTRYGLGQYPQAITLLTQSDQIQTRLLGGDHPETLSTRTTLANGLLAAGKINDAVNLHENTLERCIVALGKAHLYTQRSRNGLALAHRKAGSSAKSLLLLEEIKQLSDAQPVLNHLDWITFRENLAVAYSETGKTTQAIKIHEEVLQLNTERYGPAHFHTMSSRNNLATSYLNANRLQEAISLHEETRRLRTETLGPDHMLTLQSCNNLAAAYRKAGRNADAVAVYEPAMKASIASLGVDHPTTLALRNNLATALDKLGKKKESILLYEENLRIRTQKLGADHPDTLTAMGNLAFMYSAANRHFEAKKLLSDQLVILRKSEPPGGSKLALPLARLATIALKEKEYAQAETLLRECLEIRSKTIPNDWQCADTRARLGFALLSQKQFKEAEPLLLKGYEELKRLQASIPSDSKARVTQALEWIVELYESWNKPEDAAQWRKLLPLKAPAKTSPPSDR